MTNEEAVRLLNTFVAATYIKGLPIGKVEDVREALDMGVVALSNSDKDSISRQAAIDKMQDLEDEDIKAYGCSIPEGFDEKRAIEALKTLPSIQSTAKENLVVGDCISRQAALDKAILVDNGFGYEFKAVEIEEIQALPSIQPKTGHWISDKNGQYCDKCGNGIKTPYNFCPFCGADMREHTSEILTDSYPEWLPQYEGKWVAKKRSDKE